jgi:hypothetical protein
LYLSGYYPSPVGLWRLKMDREKYYPGTNTPVTAGLFTLTCENGHRFWSLITREDCCYCKGKIIDGLPSYIKGKDEPKEEARP